MSTRAQIRFATRETGISFNEHPNAIHAQFYVHSDGYPEGLGVEIAECFTNYGNHFARAAEPLDYMRLLFFNDTIKGMFTHSYGFNTATGRNIIETLKYKYYEYENEK